MRFQAILPLETTSTLWTILRHIFGFDHPENGVGPSFVRLTKPPFSVKFDSGTGTRHVTQFSIMDSGH